MNGLIWALLAVGQAGLGKVEPEITLKGFNTEEDCGFRLTPGVGAPIESPNGDEVEAPAGEYLLTPICPGPAGPLVGAPSKLKVVAGQLAEPSLTVTAVQVRIEARRNDTMLPARAELYPAGSRGVGAPLTTIRANQKQTVAHGSYDVVVVLEDPKSPRAEALLKLTTKTDKTIVLEANLSDGGVLIEATADGKKTSAAVRAFAPGSEKDLALVEAGQELRLPSGRYLITTELRDVADFATARRDVWIEAGKVQRYSEQFRTGTLSVSVVKDGQPVEATVRLSKAGAADFFNYFTAPGTVQLSPGSYDIAVVSEAAGPLGVVRSTGHQLTAGAKVKRVFDLTPGTLTVKVLKNGQPVFAELVVQAAGGGTALSAEANGTYRPWPGRYEIVAKLESGEELTDGPFEVVLNQKLSRTITIERAVLTVFAERGKAAASDAEIFVFKPGAAKPTAKARAGAKIELAAGTYDVKVTSGSDVIWQQGVKVKKTQTLHVELPAGGAEEPLPEGDLAPVPDDLPEGDATPDSN